MSLKSKACDIVRHLFRVVSCRLSLLCAPLTLRTVMGSVRMTKEEQ